MAQPLGPWRPRDPEQPAPRNRLLIWLGTVAVFGVGIWQLNRMFPGAISGQGDMARLTYMVAWGALLTSGFVFSRRMNAGEAARNIALWLGVVSVIVIAYMMKDTFHDALLRAQSQLIPGYGVETAPHESTLNADDNGNFDVFGQVNGATVRFTVDTGASVITLSPDDAKRAGIDMAGLVFNSEYETANGIGRGAMVTVDKLAIGPIVFFNVPVSVNQTAMHSSLLGMSFLKRMKSFEFSKDKLVLRY